ncbi:hypothetical protein ACJQWK_01564 [Exserohilum turcicum]
MSGLCSPSISHTSFLNNTITTADSEHAPDTAASNNKRWRIALACNACRLRKSRYALLPPVTCNHLHTFG